MTLTQLAVRALVQELKRDAGYRESWKANIAMAFKDECDRRRGELGLTWEGAKHEIANKAADNFLDLLCKESQAARIDWNKIWELVGDAGPYSFDDRKNIQAAVEAMLDEL